MVECKICGKMYKRLDARHLPKIHNITAEEYLEKYPDAKLICEETLEKYSQGTKKDYEKDPIAFKKRMEGRVYTEEQMAASIKMLEEGRKKLDYTSEKRSKAISEAKKAYWGTKTSEERSNFFKEVVIPKTIERLGEEEWRKSLRTKGISGYNKVLELGGKKEMNTFEMNMVDRLESMGYKTIPQYEVDGWFFDCFLEKINTLVEFDGDYWHPVSINENSSKREIKQYKIDRKKERLATSLGYKIVRIRQSESENLEKMINSIT